MLTKDQEKAIEAAIDISWQDGRRHYLAILEAGEVVYEGVGYYRKKSEE